MKLITVAILALLLASFALGQNEQAPIVEKEIEYKNWTYRNILTGQEASLRDLIRGKKLAIVVYYAPWCGNWKHDAPSLQKLYEKYKAAGLEFIAVGNYDPVESMKSNLDALKITFPAYYEAADRDSKQKTSHYRYRTSTGDTRNWGSPYYVFIDPAKIEKQGDVLLRKTHVINGEMIMDEGEKFIRQRLGLPLEPRGTAANEKIEVCDPALPVGLKPVKH